MPGGSDPDPDLWQREGDDRYRASGVDFLRDRTEQLILRWLQEEQKPVLGACRAAQLAACTYEGGSVHGNVRTWPGRNQPFQHHHYHLVSDWVDLRHETDVVEGTVLEACLMQHDKFEGEAREGWRTMSMHNRCIDSIPDGFVQNAKAPDGVIEGYEWAQMEDWWSMFLQFHPELTDDQFGRELMAYLFSAFIDASRDFRERS